MKNLESTLLILTGLILNSMLIMSAVFLVMHNHPWFALLAFLCIGFKYTSAADKSNQSGEMYFCPTVNEIEHTLMGGFDNCCTHPELHVPESQLGDALREAQK